MKLLLDTHVILWQSSELHRLGPRTRAAIELDATSISVSIVSFWELAIKVGAGKLNLPADLATFWDTMRAEATSLGLEPRHVLGLAQLDILHRDPFDRMLVAQARVEGLTLVTADERLFKYPVATLDART